MWLDFFIAVFWIVLVVYLFKLIAQTRLGAFTLVIMPLLILMVNFTIAWENYWQGIPFPNPFSPNGFIYELISRIIGGGLDGLFHVHFFEKALGWLVGLVAYSVIFGALHLWFYKLVVGNLDEKPRWIFFGLWLVFFTAFYFFRMLDGVTVFRWLSMPYSATDAVRTYYWFGLAFGVYLAWEKS